MVCENSEEGSWGRIRWFLSVPSSSLPLSRVQRVQRLGAAPLGQQCTYTHIKVKRFVCRSTSKLNGILTQHRCGKCDKKNCISLEICPGARCPGHPPRGQSSETHENRRRWPVMSDWRPAYSALSTDIGVSRMALHAGTSVPANTVRSATPTAVAKVAGSLGATPKSNALIP